MPFAPGTVGAIKADYVELPPRVPTGVPNNALFTDSAGGNTLTNKSNSGSAAPIGASSSSDILIASMRNVSGSPIAANRPVSLRADGSLVDGDSDGAGAQTYIGISLVSIANNANGNVQQIGGRVAGALTGLGFTSGAPVYLGESGGFIADFNTLTGGNDSIVRVGFAAPPVNTASGTATDLILFAEILAVAS